MRITIITAAFNAEATVGDAIRSVAGQTYRDIEHLVLDGMSNDRTPIEIARARHPGMVSIREPDGGLYDALNKGIARSTGEVIGIVHADDVLTHEQVLERVARAFRQGEVDAVYGDLDYVSKADPTRIVRHWRAGAFSPARLKYGWMPPHPALFLRRGLFEAHGGYDTGYQISADYEAILRIFGAGGMRPVYLPEVLVKMRMGGESNRSLGRILTKSREDFRAIRNHGVGGFGTLVAKNLRKLPQFVARSGRSDAAPAVFTAAAARPEKRRYASFAREGR